MLCWGSEIRTIHRSLVFFLVGGWLGLGFGILFFFFLVRGALLGVYSFGGCPLVDLVGVVGEVRLPLFPPQFGEKKDERTGRWMDG